MDIKKCVQCGGNLERLRMQKAWKCPYCGARFYDRDQEKETAPEEYYGLNEEVFMLETDLSKVMKKKAGAGCIHTIARCMSTFENAARLEEYMLSKLSLPDDISVKGVREDQIEKAIPLLKTIADSDERVIVYGNKGILSKGKEYSLVTDRRSVFVNKKDVVTVLHTDIDSLEIMDCGNCYVNGDYAKGFVNYESKGIFQGAVIALICMFAFEADPDRGRIRIV